MEPYFHDQRAGGAAGVRAITAPGPGGVAVVSVSGPLAVSRLRLLLGKELPPQGQVAYGTLSAEGTQLDEVLVIGRGPHFEVHLHGAPAIVHEVIRHLAAGGDGPGGAPREAPAEAPAEARGAESLEARAVSFAGKCASAWGARLAMDQARGHLRRALENILALPAGERPGACRALALRGRGAARLFTPTVVALTGPVNAGKSTLFNALMGRDEAVVSAAPGTTRDAISGHGMLGGWPVLFVDTAGEREISEAALAADPHARIEAEGMGLARRAAARAEVVLVIQPAGGAEASPVESRGPGEAPGGRSGPAATVLLRSRADETMGSDPGQWPAGYFAAGPEPEHARGVIGRAWAESLGLDSSAADFVRAQMGLGVPLEPEMLQRLEAAGAGAAPGAVPADGPLDGPADSPAGSPAGSPASGREILAKDLGL